MGAFNIGNIAPAFLINRSIPLGDTILMVTVKIQLMTRTPFDSVWRELDRIFPDLARAQDGQHI